MTFQHPARAVRAPAFRLRSALIHSLLLAGLAASTHATAQSGTSVGEAAQTFQLGTINVREGREAVSVDEQRLDATEMQRRNADTVSDAVRLLPGASLTRNSRNEEMIYLRGFDPRQVPVFVDGVPLYVPYDGYVDFGRFTTFDLSEIRVAKAGASLMYGPNTLGGAINLVTRRPVKPFEGDARIGAGAGGERKAAINLGGNLGSWYYQIGASYLDADSYPLPKGFRDFKKQPTDTGNYRENAYRTDKRLSFKLGLTPNATDEYALGYVRQEGEKGNPVYTGSATARNAIRYWRWPYWDKDSLYFLSSTRINADNLLKTRIYHDTYQNGLDMYTDASYARHDPTSSYKDVSQGASIEWANYSLKGHALRFGAHYKIDEHTDAASGRDPAKHYRDVTRSLVVDDTMALAERWSLNLALSHDQRDAREVYQWPTGSTSATNGLAKLAYALGSGSEAYLIASHKTRFPTIKDRYSARMGTALANPDLQPETANHLEIGVAGSPWQGAQGQAAVFYSRVRNQIQSVVVASGQCGGTTCNQAQNVGRTRNAGLDLSLAQQLSAQWSANASYSYLGRRNLSDAGITPTNTPRHRLLAGLQWRPHAQWELNAEVEAEKGRVVSLIGGTQGQTLKMAGYGIANLRARYKPRSDITVDLGVANIGDKWYQFDDGLPMPGRSWYVQLGYRF